MLSVEAVRYITDALTLIGAVSIGKISNGVPHLTAQRLASDAAHTILQSTHWRKVCQGLPEIDTTPSSPTLMMSARVTASEEGRKIEGRPQPITPLNLTLNVTSIIQTPFITPVHPDMHAVDEAFVMANY
ncbi:hypothetical protein Tco_1116814 [Tanacetum coccineum]